MVLPCIDSVPQGRPALNLALWFGVLFAPLLLHPKPLFLSLSDEDVWKGMSKTEPSICFQVGLHTKVFNLEPVMELNKNDLPIGNDGLWEGRIRQRNISLYSLIFLTLIRYRSLSVPGSSNT